jgi:hypothetical protein
LIFDSVRRKFVRAPAGVDESNLADVCHELLVNQVIRIEILVVRKRRKAMVGFCG